MKKRIGLILIMSIGLLLAACTSVDTVVDKNDEPEIREDTAIEAADKDETKSSEEDVTIPADIDDTVSSDNKARYTAYRDLMFDLLNNSYLPEFGYLSEIKMNPYMSDNQFALADADADGDEELMVYYTTTAVAGHIGAIYDYNEETGDPYLEFQGYPLFSFYGNGTLEEGWSHNQGYAGDFWPYTLHTYDKENDKYNTVGYVDAYDKSLYENNKDALAGNSFPYDIDMDGNGFVYYLYSYENGLKDYQEIEAVDDDVYQTWLKQYTEGTDIINPVFHSVTEENINQILGIKEEKDEQVGQYN